MRIAYLVNQYPKVSHSFIRREIQALERQGIDVIRIALRGWDNDLVDEADVIERKSTQYVLQDGAGSLILSFMRVVLMHPVKLLLALLLVLRMAHRADRPLPVHLVYVAEACKVFFWLREQNVDHLHSHFGTNSAEVAMLVHILGGPKWSFTIHGPEEFDRAQHIGLLEKIRRCCFVIAISSFGRSQLYRIVQHKDWPKVQVVGCGLDRDFFDDTSNVAEIVGVELPPRIVCVGRLCEQKGQLILMDAVRILTKERKIDFNLVLVGDGELRQEIEDLIDLHGLHSTVRITGWISNEQVRR